MTKTRIHTKRREHQQQTQNPYQPPTTCHITSQNQTSKHKKGRLSPRTAVNLQQHTQHLQKQNRGHPTCIQEFIMLTPHLVKNQRIHTKSKQKPPTPTLVTYYPKTQLTPTMHQHSNLSQKENSQKQEKGKTESQPRVSITHQVSALATSLVLKISAAAALLLVGMGTPWGV